MTAVLPKLVVFDLDDTLWSPEMWLCAGAPFSHRSGRVYDSSGVEIKLIGDSKAILEELATQAKWKSSRVGYASRTEYPEWANECLRHIEVGAGIHMNEVLRPLKEIYPGKKTTHFQKMHKATGIAFKDMIFFDNENRNCVDVAPLGVTCVYTPNGMTTAKWKEGLAAFAKR
mmetsp:Transcript_37400/g.81439  ORF Transcript_37400/g.81439 Transcript_37400/m.81439 type:complete len:172 (-) Transcript_37400:126-641(-)|eukprot:CAMPEP_0118930374 /NCGR_PEP_ID=MMETSP1169-20130426/7083_1 /TAXON_ID=36882 /ORGANISM="Pyramimonas obovata, Strain CCMP722" /LENGTH=171 /DNA_ID=CAMNT_0006872719 /DNA_START=100 /DNA_END=615 /DNA_ORIENTATION=+